MVVLFISLKTNDSGTKIVPKLCNNIPIFYLLQIIDICEGFELGFQCYLLEIFDSFFG